MIMRLLDLIDALNDTVGKLVSFIIWFGIAVLCFEVVARYAFDQPTIWAHGYTQRLFGSYFALIGAYTLVRHEHVRVDIFLTEHRSRRKAILDLINYAFLIVWGSVLTLEGWAFFLAAWKWCEVDDSVLGHPMWPPKLALFVGSLLITLQGVSEALRSILMFVSPATHPMEAAQDDA